MLLFLDVPAVRMVALNYTTFQCFQLQSVMNL